MSDSPFQVLYEDNHLLAIAKPANLATMGTSKGKPSLIALAKSYIKRKYNKPGNVYLGVVSRLDALATGVVIFARTSKAAARLTEQFRTGTVEKTYYAIVAGVPNPPQGHLRDWLRKDERRRKMVVCEPRDDGAVEARLSYRTLARINSGTLLEIQLDTGRKHQIRLQLAHLGHPILGDRKYGSPDVFPVGIALHARRLVVAHPVKKTPVELTASLPKAWREFGVRER